MKLENITRDDWILGGVALLLVSDVLLLPWFDIGVGVFSVSLTATDAPAAIWGVLAVLAALALIADLGVERLAPQVKLPALSGSRGTTRLGLAGAAALFVVLKFIWHVHFSLFGLGFWAGVVLAGALVWLSM